MLRDHQRQHETEIISIIDGKVFPSDHSIRHIHTNPFDIYPFFTSYNKESSIITLNINPTSLDLVKPVVNRCNWAFAGFTSKLELMNNIDNNTL
jgi:hypothetical protein